MLRRELTVMRQHTPIYISRTSAKCGNRRPRENVIGKLLSLEYYISVMCTEKYRRKNLTILCSRCMD